MPSDAVALISINSVLILFDLESIQLEKTRHNNIVKTLGVIFERVPLIISTLFQSS